MSMRNLPFIAIGLSLAALVAVIVFWAVVPKQENPLPETPKEEKSRVLIHTAAAMRVPVEKAAAEFERDTGIRVEPQFGPSEGIPQHASVFRSRATCFFPTKVTSPTRESLASSNRTTLRDSHRRRCLPQGLSEGRERDHLGRHVP